MDRITLGHGSGGALSAELLREVVFPAFPDVQLADLGRICASMREASGAGFASPVLRLHPSLAAPGDALVLNGGLGEHGVSVMAARLGVSFDPELPSDTRPLWPQVSTLLAAGITPRVMRDVTRGGLGSVACELAQGLPLDFHLEEAAIPIDPRVGRACDIWGFDPLHVASEGRFLAVVSAGESARAADLLGKGAAIVGRVEAGSGRVVLHTAVGCRRPVKPLPAELLPRIC